MEPITTLNQRLIDRFGLDSNTARPMFRIVWADDQTEKRAVEHLDSGIKLLFPEVREVKKYSYLKGVHVLERLVIVPDEQQRELAGLKLSYEPLWVFVDASGNALFPKWEPTQLIIDTVMAAIGKTSLRKYTDPELSEGANEERITKLHEELFGNETDTGDALRYKEGVVVPPTYVKEH